MKKIIIMLTIVFSIFAYGWANAEESNCELIAQAAKVVMKNRQAGATLVEMVSLLDELKNKRVKNLFMMIIKDAYSYPKFFGEEFQKNQIDEFQNKWYLKCIQLQE